MKNKGFAKAVGTVTIFSVFTRFLSFLFKVFLSRKVGAEVIGLYQISVSVFYMFASVGCSGIPQVLSRKVAEDNALTGGRSESLVTSAVILGGIFSVATALACLILGDRLSFLFADERALPLFLIMSPAIVSTSLYSVIRGYFWGRKEFSVFSLTETIEEVLRIIFTSVLVLGVFFTLDDRVAIAAAFTLSDVAVAVILIALYFVKKGRLRRPVPPKEILVPSIPLTSVRLLSGASGALLAVVLPLAFIKSGMSGSEATAEFGRITGMANPLLFAPNALISSIAVVLIPEMSENGVLGNHKQLNENLNRSIELSIIISGLFVTVYAGIGRRLTELLFDDVESGRYLAAAAITMIPMGITALLNSSLNSVGLEKRSLISFLISSSIGFLAIIFLTKYLLFYSVAVSSLLSSLASIIVSSVALKKKTGYSPDYGRTAILVLLFIIPSSLLAYSADVALAPYLGLFSVVLSGGLAALLYGAFALGFSLINVDFLFVKRGGKT